MPPIDREQLVRDLADFVRIPSCTGDERTALSWLVDRARGYGLEAQLLEHDLARVRAHPGHPGEEAPRTELLSARIGRGDVVLCGHVDVVATGTAPWRHGTAWSGAVEEDCVWGRGSVDMKAGVIAALHAVLARGGEGVELLAVSSEEDGGVGAFAAIDELGAPWRACVIPEPTAFDVVCAQAGALTFTGTVEGVAAHAAERLAGVSAIDRYVPVHADLQAFERELNAAVEHPLMAELALPYPVSVGRIVAGEWSSSVPDRLTFEGRVGVRVGEDPAAARAAVEAAVVREHVTLEWTGGQFASAATATDDPLAVAALEATRAVRGRARFGGVPWGADMRHFTAAGVPTVMVGTSGIELAHAVDERVQVGEVLDVADVLTRLAADLLTAA